MMQPEPQTTEEVLKAYGQPLNESCPCCGADVWELPNRTECTSGHRINP